MTDVQDTPVAPVCLTEKRCTRCGETKPVAEFYKNCRQKTGLTSHCKSCVSDHQKLTYTQNHDKQIARSAAYRNANQEKRKAICAAWRAANKEKIASSAAAYAAKNKDAIAARNAKNSKKNVARANAWRIANPDKRRSYYHNREARKAGNGGTHTAADIHNLLTLQKSKCACCRKSIKHGYHVDHIVPVCRGGANDKSNLQLLCPPCNMTKNAKDPVDFMQSRGLLL